jgi:hypothetical protein
MSGERDRDGTEDPQPEIDVESAFAAIVARYADPDPAVSTWPVAEDLLTGTDSTDSTDPTGAEPPSALGPGPVVAVPDPDPIGLDEHYEPPEPPPLPHADLASRLTWAAVIGGPLVLLLAAVLPGLIPSFVLALALLAFVAGFVVMVARMPNERPFDGPDDGAVV